MVVLKNYPKPEELALNFTITNEGKLTRSISRRCSSWAEFGETKTIDLVPNGADIPVNAYNKNECEHLRCCLFEQR